MYRIFTVTILLPLFVSQTPYFADTAVLDPSLYLYPSPPLPHSGDTEERSSWTRASRSTDLQQYGASAAELRETTTVTSTTIEQESMENAETFWPRLRSIDYTLKQVHVPISFSLSGNYGGYSNGGSVIGNTYANVGGLGLFSYGKSALAGSGYGSYGSPIRIYGGSDAPAWSGWGNGKWGHYGKG